jgi:hypothetical protein
MGEAFMALKIPQVKLMVAIMVINIKRSKIMQSCAYNTCLKTMVKRYLTIGTSCFPHFL